LSDLRKFDHFCWKKNNC